MAGGLPSVHCVLLGRFTFATGASTVTCASRADAVFTPDAIHAYVPVVPSARFGRNRTEKENTGPGGDVGSIVTHDVRKHRKKRSPGRYARSPVAGVPLALSGAYRFSCGGEL